ncbi:unnamed protein product [Allacma fusca]|uniref:Uncharacterized protein n=1 Tax=Allacma fusca TaxID=39272 RepID=A0A8J2KLI8_9HEXA|nr:unnamed protein product [Allacma fusca]
MEPTRKYPRMETSCNPVQQDQSTDSNVAENEFASANTLSDSGRCTMTPEYLELNCDVCFNSSEAKANHMARLADALKVERQLDAEEERAGLILGTVAYGTMKTYKSLNSYENQITCLADYGVYVGDINHRIRFPVYASVVL